MTTAETVATKMLCHSCDPTLLLDNNVHGIPSGSISPYKAIGAALDAIIVSPCKTKISDSTCINTSTSTSHGGGEQGGIHASSDFIVQFPSSYSALPPKSQPTPSKEYSIQIQINGRLLPTSLLSMRLPPPKRKFTRNNDVLWECGGGSYSPSHVTTTSSATPASPAGAPPNTPMMATSTNSIKNCTFVQGNSTKPPTSVLENLVRNQIIGEGKNLIRYLLLQHSHINDDDDSGTVDCSDNRNADQDGKKSNTIIVGATEANLYLWNAIDSIVVSDIDGTVTKSDIRGVLDSIVMQKYEHVHSGVCAFFTSLAMLGGSCDGEEGIVDNELERDDCPSSFLASSQKQDNLITNESSQEDNNNNNETKSQRKTRGKLRFLYLSSRPIRLIQTTRRFISNLSQSTTTQKEATLPSGPIFLHTGTLKTVLYTELVSKSTHEYKADVLARQVVLPFAAASGGNGDGNVHADPLLSSSLFVAGFGNKRTDALAYEMVGVRKDCIFIIDTGSVLVQAGESHYGENSNCCSDSTDDYVVNDAPLNAKTDEEDIIVTDTTHTTSDSPSHDLESKRRQQKKNNQQGRQRFINSLTSNSLSSKRQLRTKERGASFGKDISINTTRFRGYDDPRLIEVIMERTGLDELAGAGTGAGATLVPQNRASDTKISISTMS